MRSNSELARKARLAEAALMKEWSLEAAKAPETVREGLTRRAFDAVIVLTKQVQENKLPIAHAFYGLTALYETIYPFCSNDGKTTLDQVLNGWKTQIAADAAREIERQRVTEVLIARPVNETGPQEDAWG